MNAEVVLGDADMPGRNPEVAHDGTQAWVAFEARSGAETAIRVDALAAVYHDAGVGKDEAGISRLAALDPRGIAGAAVDGNSARIGDARSIWATGRISHVNQVAAEWGAKPGMTVPEFANVATAPTTRTK